MSAHDLVSHGIPRMLREHGLAGWLLYDFRRSNPLAYRILNFGRYGHFTRRWFYWLPAEGTPVKLVSALEAGNLDALPGERRVYHSWRDLHAALEQILPRGGRVAMEYSPGAAIPVVSRVDAGTIELVRGFGVDVVSSADLVQYFEARLSPDQWASHQAASAHLVSAQQLVAAWMTTRLRAGQPLSEITIQTYLMDFLAANGLVTDHPPIVAVNAHASNPHFAPSPESDTPVRHGDLLLIDFWGKLDRPGAIMADYTWVFYIGDRVPERAATIFSIAAQARDTAIQFIRDRVTAGDPIHAYEVDDAARAVIATAGYGQYFIHRTGHSIGEDTHGNGANIDNLETQDRRRLIPRTLFSIEPGIYLPDLGVRTEVNVYLGDDQNVIVTGVLQEQIETLL